MIRTIRILDSPTPYCLRIKKRDRPSYGGGPRQYDKARKTGLSGKDRPSHESGPVVVEAV